MSIVACVHQKNSKGAQKLKSMFENSPRFNMFELDITHDSSINELRRFVDDLLQQKEGLQLTAFVNNCGVMVFGESEWQTNEIIEQQINVNLLGTIKMTRTMLPLARKHKSRIINVTSHCSLKALPTLAIYASTKAGIAAFTEGLRLEMKQYGVEVVNFIPGSFWSTSNISALQLKYSAEMRESFNEEQLNYYGDYFDRLNKSLTYISGEKDPVVLPDENVLKTFEEALLDAPPKARYLCEPWRYKIYHLLFRITPLPLSDWLTWKFLYFPRFDITKAIKNKS